MSDRSSLSARNSSDSTISRVRALSENTEEVVKWVPDEETEGCMRCKSRFNMIFRRHHCRHCGFVICATCSTHRLPVKGYHGSQRVCDVCAISIKTEKKKKKSKKSKENETKANSQTAVKKQYLPPNTPASPTEAPPLKSGTSLSGLNLSGSKGEGEKAAKSEEDEEFTARTAHRRSSAPVLIQEQNNLGMRRSTIVKEVSSLHLFNVLVAGSTLVLDCRSAAEFKKASIPRSINIPLPDTKKEALTLAKLEKACPLRARMSLRRRRLADVIIVSLKGGKEATDPGRIFANLILDSRSLGVLDGGFQKFTEMYPFTVGHRPIPWYPTVVLDKFLYLGNVADSRNLKHIEDLRITSILNVSSEVENKFPDKVEYLHINITDEKSSNLCAHFDKVFEFLDKVKAEDKRCLVHCYQGVSRSATVVLGYLMKSQGWSLKKAHSYLKFQRPIIQPNPGFWKQLSDLEKDIFGDTT